MFILEVNKMDT